MTELENLQKEVIEYYYELRETHKDKISYVGYKIFYSKFSKKTDILFIGINPGGGELGEFSDESLQFEYTNPEINNYALAQGTLKAFKAAGYENLLSELDQENRVMKTNFFYYIDTEEADINKFRSAILSKEEEFIFYDKARIWTKKIIEMSRPKLIICEGKLTYDLLKVDLSIVNEIPHIDVIETECDNYSIITYSRLRSYIRNAALFTEILKKKLEAIYG
ncbi:MAG: hypothetical protein K0M63_11565 [Weeksellaceae bacterium]|nr:hypothetical protein [Weeksellaceae bacterium]